MDGVINDKPLYKMNSAPSDLPKGPKVAKVHQG
jgi:hypothetical protein